MKLIKYILFTLLVVGGTTGCKKDFFDVSDPGNLYRQDYVKDLATLQHFMNGIYIRLTSEIEDGYFQAYPELVADNLKLTSTSNSGLMVSHYTWSQQANDFIQNPILNTTYRNMNPLWKTGYQVIRFCNFVLEEVTKYHSENPALADNIKGQAYAIRALVHFKLVNTFAQCYKFTADGSHPGIPYITASDITIPFSRQTVAEVYNNMIADYTNAIQLLPAIVTDTRIMNRAAARALLARTYLFKEDFTNAKTLAVEVATQFPLMTIAQGYPTDLFIFKTDPAQTESLFQLSPQTATYITIFLNHYLRVSTIRFISTSDVALILKENPADARQAWVNNVSGQWRVLKFPVGVAPEVTPAVTPAERAYYPAIIRSSEMFLTAAEASAKLNDEVTARTYLNAVRKRANPATTDVIATGQALIDSIYKERRKELAFEGLRMYDLQRWKLGVHRTDATFAAFKDLAFPNNKSIAPIPSRDETLAGLPQNTGY